MQKVFWAKLVGSLSPAAQGGRDELVVGALVQARYGGAQGAFYDASVTAVHADGTFDIRYVQDKVEECRCPLAQFRLRGDPVDARPLLALVAELRSRLERATPPRLSALRAQIADALDAPWLSQMLLRGVLEADGMLRLA
jgi:hypothetical protein